MMRWVGVGLAVFAMFILAPFVGLMSQPWAPWWFGQHTETLNGLPTQRIPDNVTIPVTAHGFVDDRQRYILARAAGWTPDEAVTATAISIAEDGSGDPAALSGANWDGSRDLGLWQINSGWWPQFGGSDALVDPLTNARAGHVIYQRQGWCAWSVYEARCGPGHTGAYSAFLARARNAAFG